MCTESIRAVNDAHAVDAVIAQRGVEWETETAAVLALILRATIIHRNDAFRYIL